MRFTTSVKILHRQKFFFIITTLVKFSATIQLIYVCIHVIAVDYQRNNLFLAYKMMEMETHQESTYEPLEGRRRNRLESTDSPDIETPSPAPQDRNGILYIALVAAGIGFVLPYNRYFYFEIASVSLSTHNFIACGCVAQSTEHIV